MTSEFREYEVAIFVTVSAPSHAEAEEAVARSGIKEGGLIGETLISAVSVWPRGDDADD